jgi:hypothetical protein
MFIGHFACGLAAAPVARKASLPWLLVAPQVPDVLWPILVGARIEHAHIAPGITAAEPLSLDYMPYSHSLVSVIVQAIGFALLYMIVARDRRAAPILALLVISHWVCDWIAHAPDMPIFHGDGPRYGLGLWNSVPATIAVEAGLFAIGCAIYAATTRARDRVGAIGWWSIAGFLFAAFFFNLYGPPPSDIDVLLIMALAVFAIIPLSAWVARHREVKAAQ